MAANPKGDALGRVLEGPIEIPIQGQSMRPLIQSGDTVRVSPYPQTPVAVGDVVLFRREKSLVAHRVIAMKEENGAHLIAERGDNAILVVWRPAGEIVGRVERVIRGQRVLDLNRGAGKAVGRIMNLYWSTIKSPGLPKRILIYLLELYISLTERIDMKRGRP